MRQVNLKSKYFFIIIASAVCFLSSCGNLKIPASLPGTYTGNERVIIRYEKNGQFIFRDEYVKVNLTIDSAGQVTGMVGEASFEGCNVMQNRGWIERQLGIKTDFLIKGLLQGSAIAKDTLFSKEISIPFNIVNNELKGSLFMQTNRESFPLISNFSLIKMKNI